MNTSNPIHTKRCGPFFCKGDPTPPHFGPAKSMTSNQVAWMKANKPLYFTGNLWLDLIHLPIELRHV